jgi:hypothetical protein
LRIYFVDLYNPQLIGVWLIRCRGLDKYWLDLIDIEEVKGKNHATPTNPPASTYLSASLSEIPLCRKLVPKRGISAQNAKAINKPKLFIGNGPNWKT